MSLFRQPVILVILAVTPWAMPRASADYVDLAITELETRDPPTRARIQSVEDTQSAMGWNALVVPIRNAAIAAYSQDRFEAADSWYHLYRWAALLSEPENRFLPGWMDAITAAQVAYPGVAGDYRLTDRPLGLNMSADLQSWILANDAFSEQFFSSVQNVDYLPRVFSILESLHAHDPARFAKYSSLALAIALVYDVPPPPYWPHLQVSPASLPRKLQDPVAAFDRLTQADALGHTFHQLARLRAEELKFVVDSAAPAPELAWAIANVPCTLDTLEDTYNSVNYRTDRAAAYATLVWTGQPYTLQAIRAQGGICIDRAYFATEVGKARGVPTLIFTGAGMDAHHAWFGYLDGEKKWRLDAGRYAEQRLVTGVAFDPQTWTAISDHELQFLSERFRALPSFMESRVHEEFAQDFLEVGDAAQAARAARIAVNYEHRNVEGWETLYAADRKLGLPGPELEGVLREAALAFSPRYPDLVRYYVNRVVQSLRARGETSLANFEENGLAARLKIDDRSDLAIRQASAILSRSLSQDPVPGQIATYDAILAQFGHGAGTLFFDQVVTAFAEHLLQANMRPQARQAVERAREVLEVQPGTQFAMDVDKLLDRLKD